MTTQPTAGTSLYRRLPNKGHHALALKYVTEKVREKCEKYPTHLTDEKFIMRDFPDSVVTWGAASAYVAPHGGKPYRVLVKDNCIQLDEDLWATPMDAVRYYLDFRFEKLPMRARGAALDACRYPRRKAPGYCNPWVGQAGYYDLKSAYWSIAQLVGFDLQYHPGKYLKRGSTLGDFPFYEHKQARNTLVTIGIQNKVRQYDTATREYRAISTGNRYKNVMLWAFIMDVLNAIAVTAVAHGAQYVNTDGYIIPDNRKKHALEAMRSWGLPIATDYEGDTEVRYIGSYKVADKITGHWLLPGNFNRLQLPVDMQWLHQRVSRAASETSFITGYHER